MAPARREVALSRVCRAAMRGVVPGRSAVQGERSRARQPSRSEHSGTLQHSSEIGSSRRLRSSPRSQAPSFHFCSFFVCFVSETQSTISAVAVALATLRPIAKMRDANEGCGLAQRTNIGAALLRLDACLADDLPPLRYFRPKPGGAVLGRAGDRLVTERRQAFLHVRPR